MIQFKRPVAHFADPSRPPKLKMQSLLSCSSLRAKISSSAKSIQVFETQKNPKSQQQMNTKRYSQHASNDVMAHPMGRNQDLCSGPSTMSITIQKLIEFRFQAIQMYKRRHKQIHLCPQSFQFRKWQVFDHLQENLRKENYDMNGTLKPLLGCECKNCHFTDTGCVTQLTRG